MKIKVFFVIRVFFLFLALAVFPASASAHALEGRVLQNEKAIVVGFDYASESVPRFAKASVFSPSNSEVEFQVGRTDMLGRVSFVPDEPGLWKVEVSDGQGHRAEVLVAVEQAGVKQEAESYAVTSASRFFKVLFGLSLILNLSFVLFWLLKRSRRVI